MSMSQEEIEALMNGLDLTDEEKPQEESVEPAEEESSTSMSEDDIEQLIAATNSEAEASSEEPAVEETVEESVENVTQSNEDESDTSDNDETLATPDVKNDITDVLNEIDNMTDSEEESSLEEISSVEDDLTPMDDISTDELEEELIQDFDEDDNEGEEDFNKKAESWTSEKINKGEFPLPVEPNTKVVSQLNEVANDSEEKASKIFDVLSFILDENDGISKNRKDLDAFIDKEIELLNSLSKKFPNIAVFKERLEEAENMKAVTADIGSKVDAENMQVFEAMELMQFHDINRQKIERVMSVIRKLSTYLNNLFEEEGEVKEIAVAKYIHGDGDSDVVGAEDLDALIQEFNK